MELPSPAALFAIFITSLIGFVAFRYGKQQQRWQTMILGIVLMIYPYFISATWLLYVVGGVLCAALYFFRD